MPVVQIRYNPEKVTQMMVGLISVVLPKIVAEKLDVPTNPKARLSERDISLWFLPPSDDAVYTRDLEILIFVHAYPERMRNADERAQKINERLRELVCLSQVTFAHVSHFVWIFGGQTGFSATAR